MAEGLAILVQPLLAPEVNRFLNTCSEQWITTLKIASTSNKSGVIKLILVYPIHVILLIDGQQFKALKTVLSFN